MRKEDMFSPSGGTTLVIIVLVGVGLYIVSTYNTLQQLKTQIAAAIQEIGNQLKRQASLIPNLENAVKGFMKQEKGIFELLASARKSVETASANASGANIDKAITDIQGLVPKISIMVEDNPELKSDTTVTKFMSELTDTADKLTYARRTVIDLTQNFNAKLVMFPSNLIAGMFNFRPEKGLQMPADGTHLSVSEAETQDIKVDL
jgi:LemA protein